MKVSPLDVRQMQFATAMRGYDKNEVRALLADAADDYEQALREVDRLKQELARSDSALAEHRDREINLRNTLLTAQRLADQIKDNAEQEAKMLVREAEGRADLLLEKAHARLEEIERDISELKLRRRDVEATLEASISALSNALDFVRSKDEVTRDEKILLHRPRTDAPARAPEVQSAQEA
ncbi:MAG: DivIVA domain-containing protein [Vicinamibacterales bacterium]|jgi:cell division initiation protein|nr:DivIVA domain-containing protein [Vicinamibacterales bacterium]